MNIITNKVIAVILLILSILIWPFFYILIKLDSKGPFIFKQKRMGQHKKIFTIYKIRTMRVNADKLKDEYKHLNEAKGPVFKIKNDPRHTKIGQFLALTGLDELPQLFNILQGNMALVGPRPLPVDEARRIPKKYQGRLSVLPGITSLWVIKGSHKLGFDKWMRLDLEYISKRSLPQDISILFQTILLILGLVMKKVFRRETVK